MNNAPTRSARLPVHCERGLAWGDKILLSQAHPDESYVLDLRSWPPSATLIEGFFAPSAAQTAAGQTIAVARHRHQNPYQLYEVDLERARVAALPLRAAWRDLDAIHPVGGRVLVQPSRGYGQAEPRPAFYEADGEVRELALPPAPEPQRCTVAGRTYVSPQRLDGFDARALGGDEALCVWFENLHRVAADATTTPLGDQRFFVVGDGYRDGRQSAVDARGRAVGIVHDRLVAIDREGAYEDLAQGSPRARAATMGPDGSWFIGCEDAVHWVFCDAREAIVIDLRELRAKGSRAIWEQRCAWIPARDALLVFIGWSVHEYALSALRKSKRATYDALAAKRATKTRSAWQKLVTSARAQPIAMDALPSNVAQGVLVEHPEHGVGVVRYARETMMKSAWLATATISFEQRDCDWFFSGERWVEQRWALR